MRDDHLSLSLSLFVDRFFVLLDTNHISFLKRSNFEKYHDQNQQVSSFESIPPLPKMKQEKKTKIFFFNSKYGLFVFV